jgi:PAS domain S-box-containing protein
MGAPGPAPEIGLDEVLEVFTAVEQPSTPFTATEVAEELDCKQRTARRTLERLNDRGTLATKETAAHDRVWWLPASSRDGAPDADPDERPELAEFGDFVSEVEDCAIFALDSDGTVATWNEGARRIKGYERSEIVGEHFSNFYTEADVEAGIPRENLAAAIAGGRVEDEGWRIRADGTEFWANVVITAIRDDDGDLRGFTKVTRDMTERREYEQRLERERERTEKLLRTAPIPIAVVDDAGETVVANERAQDALGLTEEEIVEGPENQEEWTIYGGDGEPIDQHETPSARVLETGEPVYDAEIAVESPEGERTWFSINAAPFAGPEGTRDRVVIAGEDVTSLKERERELESELSEVLGRVSDAFYALDDELRFTHVNDAATSVLQHSREELLGESIWDVFSIAAESDIREEFERAFESQEPQAFEEYYEDSGRWLEFNAYPSETGVSVYFRDVTERKERQRDLARYETIVETVEDGIYVVDQDGRFRMVNEAYTEMTGYDREELLGEHVSLVVDETVRRDAKRLEAKLTDGEVENPVIEAEIDTASGDSIPSEATFSALRSPEEGRHRIGVARDITDRKEYERELKRKERRYQAVFEDPNILVGLLDPDGTVLDINDTAMEYVDAELEDVVGEQFAETPWWEADEGIRSDVRSWVDRAVTGEYVDFEADLTRPDGDRYTLSGYFRPVTNDDGEVVSIIVSDRDITERREYERELERSERRYRTLVENFPNGAVALVDDDLRYTTVGGEPVDRESDESSDLEGKTIREAIEPELADEVEPLYVAALDGESSTIEIEQDGETAQIRIYPVRDDEGEVFAAMGMSQDVTERVERERELERALDLLEKTERIADVGGWEIEMDTETVFWSDHLFDILGYEGEEAPPLDEALEVYHEADRHLVEDAVDAAFETGAPFDVEARFPRPEGGVGWLSIQGDPEVQNGDVTTLRGAVQDVTERVRRERELEDRAKQQHAVSEIGQLALETTDVDAIMDEAARRVAEVLDTDYGKVLDMDDAGDELLLRQGVGWQDGIVGSATVGAHEADSQAGFTLESNDPVVVDDLEADHRFGGPELLTAHDVSSGISTVIGSRDDPWGILGTHDTEPRDFNEEDVDFVQSVANVLAGAIERHRYQRELEELVDQLEESNERLERFAYVASHDLQEPLRMISNYLQLLDRRYRDELDSDAEEFIDFAVDGADRMREMIDDLLAYSRLDTEAEPFEPTDVGAVVQTVREDLRLHIEETDATLTVGDLPTVEADENQLEMVFQNLLSNAIKYSGDQPPEIEVDAERGDDECVFRVGDEGIGMEPERTEDVFDVFKRLHTHDDYPGTGIGLAMCRKIVRHHGGRIWLESEPGDGSTVYFTVPADVERSAETEEMTREDRPLPDAGDRGTDE